MRIKRVTYHYPRVGEAASVGVEVVLADDVAGFGVTREEESAAMSLAAAEQLLGRSVDALRDAAHFREVTDLRAQLVVAQQGSIEHKSAYERLVIDAGEELRANRDKAEAEKQAAVNAAVRATKEVTDEGPSNPLLNAITFGLLGK